MAQRATRVFLGLAACGLVDLCGCKKPEPSGSSTSASPSAAGPSSTKPGAVTIPTIDEKSAAVIAAMTGKWDALQGVSAKISTRLAQAAEKPGLTHGEGSYSLKKRDGDPLLRIFLNNIVRFDVEAATRIKTMEVLTYVHDGADFHVQLQQPNLKKTTKKRFSWDGVLAIGGSPLFKPLQEKYSLRYLGEEPLDGVTVDVLEATPVEGDWKQKHYFDQASGIRLRMIETDAAGKESVTISISEVNLNPEFSEGTFTYTLPEGFELIDATGGKP